MPLTPKRYEIKREEDGFTISRPGFENCLFSKSSPEAVTRVGAAEYAASLQMVPTSLQEDAAVRMEAGGTDDANLYRIGRAVDVSVVGQDGLFYNVHDDTFDPELSLVLNLTIAEQIEKAHREAAKCLLDRNAGSDLARLVNLLVERGTESGRIVLAPQAPPVKLSLKSGERGSEYAQSPHARTRLGDQSQAYGEWLAAQGFEEGYVYTPTVEELRKIGLKDGFAAIWGGGLGCDYFLDGIYGYNRFYVGRARGVRNPREFSM